MVVLPILLAYKGIALDLLFQYVKQIGINTMYRMGGLNPGAMVTLRAMPIRLRQCLIDGKNRGDRAQIARYTTQSEYYILGKVMHHLQMPPICA